MKRCLLAWELGMGLGHLVKLKPLVNELISRGIAITLAAKDVTRGMLVFGNDIQHVQAPIKNRSSGNEIEDTMSFAQVLHNCGFGTSIDLRSQTVAWKSLFRHVRPDVLLAEHSPTALLAARGEQFPAVVAGTGFVCPPATQVFPNLRFWKKADPDALARDEAKVLQRVNTILREFNSPELGYLSDLYSQTAECFLMTVKELDHYPFRKETEYWGCNTYLEGEAPTWLPGDRPRVFAYLKPMTTLSDLLEQLRCTDYDILIYGPGISADVRKEYSTPTLRFHPNHLDMQAVGGTCDAAILNGTHGSALSMLLSGKPALHIPMFLEQKIVAGLVRKQGGGLGLDRTKTELTGQLLKELIEDDKYRQAAMRFSQKYAALDHQRSAIEITTRILALCG